VCTVSGSTVTMQSAGTCSLTADQAGNANYDPAPQVSLDVVITAPADLTISMSSRDFVQYGKTLDYTIVVENVGGLAVSNAVSGTLPPELDLAAAWTCTAELGASCGAPSGATDGMGHFTDTPTLPPGGKVTYVLATLVLDEPVGDTVVSQVTVDATGDGDSSNNTASWTTHIVIFRDGFEEGGDGAQDNPVP
jgi:uncharacterized repeat protein (TIGR01451 family)